LIHDGERIAIDPASRRLDLLVDESALAERRRSWRAPAPRYTAGAMAKYARLVSSASEGAITGTLD
jgi:dihydroxy-acid dehydratase